MTGKKADPFIIRRLTHAHLHDVMSLVESVGWTHVAKDLEIMFSGAVFLGAYNHDDVLLATGALYPYGKKLASLGMIMVNPNYQRQGLGRAIMAALHDVEEAQGRQLCLIATEEGEPLYAQLGYLVVSRIRKFFADPKILQRDKYNEELSSQDIRLMRSSDIPEILELDKKSFGGDRAWLLRLRIKQSTNGVICVDKQEQITGFSLSVPQRDQMHIGPVVSQDLSATIGMIRSLAILTDKELRIDVPEEQHALHELLSATGFRLVANPPAMLKGQGVYPGSRDHYWAIMSQAYA